MPINLTEMKANSNDQHSVKQKCCDTNKEMQNCRCKNIELALKDQEETLRKELQEHFNLEISLLKERFDFILQNEQIRCSYMLREAYRDRQQKISALQTQLECKNLAGLMYVLCTERRKAQLEKLNIIEEYTNRIHELQEILTEAQNLILDLSRGYKTATRVDHEWREKMKKVLYQFQNFAKDFCGGTIQDTQHLFDLSSILRIESPLESDPNEDPCETYYEPNKADAGNANQDSKPWWQHLDDNPPPFVVYGDLGDMKPEDRREVLRSVKAVKTAPKKWKDYVFNEMFLHPNCENIEQIKKDFKEQYPLHRIETIQTRHPSCQSYQFSHRATATNMGSILKMITTPIESTQYKETTKSTILGARDSIEIASTCKLLKDKSGRHSETQSEKIKFSVGNRRNSILQELAAHQQRIDSASPRQARKTVTKEDDNEEVDDLKSFLGSLAHDSLEIIPDHVPDKDAKIQYEKVCPMEECQHLQVDSFIKSLPPYMRANPFLHFEQTFEEYETCSPEQLKILKERIEMSRRKSTAPNKEKILSEWLPASDGVATQTSLDLLPECNCGMSIKSEESALKPVFSLKDLCPVKATMDKIRKECLFDDQIEFNRFKVMGEEDHPKGKPQEINQNLSEVQRALRRHPSLCKMFQANTN